MAPMFKTDCCCNGVRMEWAGITSRVCSRIISESMPKFNVAWRTVILSCCSTNCNATIVVAATLESTIVPMSLHSKICFVLICGKFFEVILKVYSYFLFRYECGSTNVRFSVWRGMLELLQIFQDQKTNVRKLWEKGLVLGFLEFDQVYLTIK